jgi:hypothetical protein
LNLMTSGTKSGFNIFGENQVVNILFNWYSRVGTSYSHMRGLVIYIG